MTMTQLLLDGFTPAKPKKRQAPVILARRKTTCGFRCGHDIRIGDPITVLSNGRWVHVHDVNDKDIARRGAQLVGEAMLKKTGSRLVQDGAFTRIVGCTCSACLNGQPEICVGDWDEPIPDSVQDVNGAGLIDTEGCDITPSSEGFSEEEAARAGMEASMYPDEYLEETAEWQRAHLPPEERWHPDLVAAN